LEDQEVWGVLEDQSKVADQKVEVQQEVVPVADDLGQDPEEFEEGGWL
jgi:hypothetical protein